MLAAGWIEASSWAAARGTPVQPTYDEASRIDFILISPRAAPCLREVHTLDLYTFPRRKSVQASFVWEMQDVPSLTWKLPLPLPLEGVTKEDVALIALRHKDETLQRWRVKLEAADMDDFVQDWRSTSEAVLVAAIETISDVVLASEYRGRGHVLRPKVYTKPSPPSLRCNHRCDRIRKVYRQVAHLHRLGNLTLPQSRTRASLWETMCTGPMQKDVFRGIPHYAGLPLHLALVVPGASDLRKLQSFFASLLHAASRDKRVGIFTDWKADVRKDMRKGGSKAYRRIRPPCLAQDYHSQGHRV